MLSMRTNEGVILMGIVQILLGVAFIVMSILHNKFLPQKENLTRFQKSFLAIVMVTLCLVYFCIDYYLNLPETDIPSKTMLRATISLMALVALVYSYGIENSKVDRKLKRMTLYTYLTGKKVSYLHICMVMVGAVLLFVGCDSIFIL